MSLFVMSVSFISCSSDDEEAPAEENLSVEFLLGEWSCSGLERNSGTSTVISGGPMNLNPFYRERIRYVEFTNEPTQMDDGTMGYVLIGTTHDGAVVRYNYKIEGNWIKGSLINNEVSSYRKGYLKTIGFKVETDEKYEDGSYWTFGLLAYYQFTKSTVAGTYKGTNDTWEFYFYFNEDGSGTGEGHSRTGSEYKWVFNWTLNDNTITCNGYGGFVGFDGEVSSNPFNTTFTITGTERLKGGPFRDVIYSRF